MDVSRHSLRPPTHEVAGMPEARRAASAALFCHIKIWPSPDRIVFNRPWINNKENSMAYVEGFVIAVPKGRLEDYKAMARICEPIWREYGARDYVECVGDDTPYGEVTSFPRAVQAKQDE